MKANYLLLLILMFILIPVSAARPMTSLFSLDLEASLIQIGFITAAYSMTPLLIAIFVGRFVDRYGERTPLIIGSVGIAVALTLPFLYPSLLMLLLSQLLLGGSQFIALVACQNGIARLATSQNRDKAVSSLSLAASLGTMLGPLLGGYLSDQIGFKSSYMFLGLMSLLPLLLSWLIRIHSSKIEQTNAERKEKVGVKEILAIPGLKRTMIISMLILSSLDIFNVYYPLYAQSIGLSHVQIGLVLATQAFASIIIRVCIPFLILKLGRIQALFIFMFSGAIAYGFLPVFHHLWAIILVTIIIGIGLGITQPLTIIISYNLAPKGRTGEVLGIRLAGNRLAQVIIPLFFASISTVIGLGSIFIIKAILLCVGSAIVKGINEGKNANMPNY